MHKYTYLQFSFEAETVQKEEIELTSGVNLFISDTQFGTVDKGATTRYGPLTPISIRWAIRAMHWMVLPRPISSANIPFTPFS